MRWFIFIIISLTGASAFGFESDRGDFRIDEEGRALRASFPVHERVWCESGVQKGVRSPSVGCGWDFRFALDFEDEAVFWRMRHRAFELRWKGQSRMALTLVDADYHRHDESSFVLVPGPNWKIPAEFDLAFQYRIAQAHFDLEGDEWLPTSVEVLDTAILADLWRDPDFRGHFGIGIAGRFDLGSIQPLEPIVMPFSGARIYVEWQDTDGLFGVSGRATCGVSADVNESRWVRDCSGAASLEWTPLAVNDLPVSLVLDTLFVESPRREWRAGAALRWSLPTE